ncbi:MAG: ABC transporter permease, partial [Longimicrobiales bacterium]
MLIGETVGVALSAIRANKMRSFLTMLGVIIGIAAVITMVALGEGAQRQVEAQLASLGTNVLTVRPGQQMFGGVDRGENRMTQDDARALLDSARTIRAASPEMQRRLQVSYEGANSNSSVVGVWPAYFDIENHAVARGRLFSVGEERGRRRVALLGAKFGERLEVPTESLLGRTIRI